MRRRKVYLHKVDSRAVDAMDYDKLRRELQIVFRSEPQRLYVYSRVSLSEWQMLQKTSSLGAIVNAHIKTRHAYQRFGPDEVEIIIRP
ncbi:MAG TPA: KTSC domain-containing protein [Stellaceae bacterium]|jgi:hypothetical protein|nr:KTSC domain-containing protein [Stellaceae bacterium]